MIGIDGLRIAGLYLLLKKIESGLDRNIQDLADELEAYLYNSLSIQEMEELEKLYIKNDERLKEKLERK